MKQKCRNNQCLRTGEWINGICPKCEALIKKGFATRKKAAKEKRKALSKTSANNYPKALRRAKAAFQRLRRIQEADSKGYVKCVHGGIRHYTKADAGHYLPAKYLFTCFNPDNVWPQEKHKNMDMDTFTTVNEYREFLKVKIGEERLRFLEDNYRIPVKYTAFELNAMAEQWEKQAEMLIKKKF